MNYLYLIILVILSVDSSAQEAIAPRPSPTAIVATRYKDTYLKLTYSQPHKKGRQVFGALVPFGQVWRTGANEATEITLTRGVKVNEKDLPAGTYSVFSIPEADKWTIIFNSDLGLWGAYNYQDKYDVLRLEVPVMPLTDTTYEAFTIWIEQKNDKAELMMAWEKTKVNLSIQFQEPKP